MNRCNTSSGLNTRPHQMASQFASVSSFFSSFPSLSCFFSVMRSRIGSVWCLHPLSCIIFFFLAIKKQTDQIKSQRCRQPESPKHYARGNPDVSALIEIRIPPSGRIALFPFVNSSQKGDSSSKKMSLMKTSEAEKEAAMKGDTSDAHVFCH
ncbi:hypothetical protein CEXT_415281 [Caerostris extrusa]|uniref:Uncharacterized protein n=1 Tax=Caerostris extrusa TaxID=172846 RepID=A0AAV4MST5_CAEEX|nr:hypothetical protein CEXT_415281 [Caerostris extrusa]